MHSEPYAEDSCWIENAALSQSGIDNESTLSKFVILTVTIGNRNSALGVTTLFLRVLKITS